MLAPVEEIPLNVSFFDVRYRPVTHKRIEIFIFVHIVRWQEASSHAVVSSPKTNAVENETNQIVCLNLSVDTSRGEFDAGVSNGVGDDDIDSRNGSDNITGCAQ